MWTVGELLREAARFLEGQGVGSARLEAELLLAHALGLDRVQLYVNHGKPLTPSEVDLFRELCRRRVRGEPTAYIIGIKEFFSLPFSVSPDVLIPRPETEELVEACLDLIPGSGQGLAAADIGTGSGCIAITLAVHRADLTVAATDLSRGALERARENAALHEVDGRITFLCGDLGAPLMAAKPDGGFQILACNPPYIDPQGALPVDRAVARFEPSEALFTPPGDPLIFYRKVLHQARDLLATGGHLVFEVAMGLADEVVDLGRKCGFKIALRRKDLAGIPRVVGFRL